MSAEKMEFSDPHEEVTELVATSLSESTEVDSLDDKDSVLTKVDEKPTDSQDREEDCADKKRETDNASAAKDDMTEPAKDDEMEPTVSKPEDTSPKLLDLAFAMDCTGSMGSYIHQAQNSIREIVEEIVSKEAADVHLALVEYRDHPPQETSFVTRVHDFTGSVREMKGWLDNCSASGGGDTPEAVADALHQVLKLSWRPEATKICVFICDAPPHGLNVGGDGFPNGCPDGLDPLAVTDQIAEKSITIYLVGCEPSINSFKEFYMAVAHKTGGQYVPLSKAKLLPAVITGGAQEELSLQQLMAEIHEEVAEQLQQAGEGVYSHRELSRKVHSKMSSKGYKTQALRLNAQIMPQASVKAENISYCTNLGDLRSKMAATSSSSHDYAEMPGPHSMMTRSKGKSLRSKSGRPVSSKAPHAAETESQSSMWSRMTGAVSGLFGYSKTEELASPSPLGAATMSVTHDERARPPRGAGEDVYQVVEQCLAEEQVHRMVQKSLMQKNLRSNIKQEGEEGEGD